MAAPPPHLEADIGVGHHRPVSYIQPLWETEGVETQEEKGRAACQVPTVLGIVIPVLYMKLYLVFLQHFMLDYPHMLGVSIKDQMCV